MAGSLAGAVTPGATAGAASAAVEARAVSDSLHSGPTPEAAATGRTVVAPLPASLSMSSVPSTAALRTDVVAPDSHGPVRDRKVESSASALPGCKDLLSAYGVKDAMDHFSAHYRSTSGAAQPGEAHAADRRALVEALRKFRDALPREADHAGMVVNLAVKLAMRHLVLEQIGADALRPFWRDICVAVSEAGVPLRCVAPALQSAVLQFDMSQHNAGLSLCHGLVDSLERIHLRGTFDSRDVDASARKNLEHVADIAIRQRLLATALGELRLRHEPQTRRLGMPMDSLGQFIAERARTASVNALSAVAQHITAHAAMHIQGKEGFELWRCSLEPVFRGSLANDDKRAAEGVVRNTVRVIDVWMATLGQLGIPRSSDAERLNLDEVSAAFMRWMSDAPSAQREKIHACLAQALAKMGAPRPTARSGADVDAYEE